jgi:hypothetical protein
VGIIVGVDNKVNVRCFDEINVFVEVGINVGE